ncbi:RagB/SusD family nutrient uptake outer membrane protein [Fulvivirga sp. M361]|uniref:RagB/SusD family nutrient uptake outer membrane protein n=1 Tax=Fulvivirga sp. M361 TaxID=2594266 RepID=UPI00117ACE8E|nr:RagB/SusD family nutrient uptake outer membrane protein [Fulvivirga sp. M361]TRX59046.1 RagB/SusD family nutrient uptake outer membrane protein [Fulvivirga sp. M361]
MKKYIYQSLLLVVFVLFACEDDFLDRELDTNYNEDQVFSTYTTIRDFGTGIYAYLPEGFSRINGAMLASASDDALHSGTGTAIQSLTNGSWGALNNPDDQWGRFYSGIRKVNLFLEKTVDYETIVFRDTISDEGRQNYWNQTNDLKWLRAESRFLRAFFHFELAKRYGGVPIITEVLSPESPARERNSFEECISFIDTEITSIMDDLRLTWSGFDNDKKVGRATQGAALALRARALLYAASPLHNTGNSIEKWQKAAEAAHEVILLNQYSLEGNYRNLFRSITSDEFILARRYAASADFERLNYPVGFEGAMGGTNPSQNLVDVYETINGLSIADDPSYDSLNPYVDRDPRLSMTVIVNDSEYKGRRIEIWDGGKDAPDKPRGTRTGYYLKKYVDEGLDLTQNRTSVHTWVYFRYAEVLLNYAEAMNEAYGPDNSAGFSLSAQDAVNMVRQRPGINMPDIAESSQEEFRKRIRRERRVELAFEEHRFWDARRWMIGEESLGSPIYGVRVTKNSDDFLYEYSNDPVEQRIFEKKMYLYPIPREEIIKTNGTLTQNTGW